MAAETAVTISSVPEGSGVVVADIDGRIIAADRGFCDVVGLHLHDVIGSEPPYPWWPEDQVPWFRAQLGPRLRSAPHRRRFEGEWIRPNGRRMPVEGRATAVRSADGTVEFVVSTVAVICSSASEEAADGSRKGKSPLEPWLGTMFQSNIVGIVAGRGHQVMDANDAFLELLGYTREEFEQGGIDWAELTPPEWHDVDARAGEVMLREGASPTIEKEYYRKDGGRVRVRIAGAVVSENPFTWISVVEDRTAERDYIEAVRRALVPPVLPQPPGMAVHARYYASDGFTGDFYDLFPLRGSEGWGLVLGDVAGHGHAAASLTALARHALRGAALAEPRPARALALLNQAILDADAEPAYCTAVFAQLRRRGGVIHVRIARAGHPPPLVVRKDGTLERLAAPGLPLGMFHRPGLREDVVSLELGDVLVLHTDGLTETRPDEQPFPDDALDRICHTAAGTSPREVAEAILDRFHERLSRPLADDIAVITLGLGTDASPGSRASNRNATAGRLQPTR